MIEKRPLGKSGPQVSVVGLGCNNFGGRIDLEATRKVVHKALDLGITLFDTADIYGDRGGSETCLGEILGSHRKDIVLASKFGMQMDDAGRRGASRAYIMSAVEASLKRLKTDWIDLYQLHRPDPATPIEETLRALDDLVRAGKVRYIGCSNLTAAQLDEAQLTADRLELAKFGCCQEEYSLLVRDAERELFPAMERLGLGFLPYYPLASGMLTGKYPRGQPVPAGTRFAMRSMQRNSERFLNDRNYAVVDRVAEFAAARGRTLLELAMSWLAERSPVASVIAGATKPQQVEANVRQAGSSRSRTSRSSTA